VGIYFFDVLFIEGKSLLNFEFKKRRNILEKVITVIPNRIMVSEYVECVGSIENREVLLSNQISSAISLGLEGLVLKDLKSIYEPGARHWTKMKKGIGLKLQKIISKEWLILVIWVSSNLIQVVLGAYFGSGSNGSIMSVFLMGCYDEDTKLFKTCCKCGNGHNTDKLVELNKELISNMKKIKQDFSLLPNWIDCDKSLTPDFICKNPWKSVVWEMRYLTL
jgi:DNA ligase 3